MSIRVGSNHATSGGVLHYISWKKVHRKYRDGYQDFDVGVINVTTPFEFGKLVQPVALVAPASDLPVGAMGVVTGWGRTQEWSSQSSHNLRKVEVPILSYRDCKEAYGLLITKTMFCAGYLTGERDACVGDSGGALVVKKTQFGIISWGVGCARPHCPGVYTHIAVVRSWITEMTGV
ncbi:Trypsin-7, partial [Gryllus bimaculatus]